MTKLTLLYGKKLGLPHFSSHEASASVEIELLDLSEAAEQIDSLYSKLQESIDTQLQTSPGFTPFSGYGIQPDSRQMTQTATQPQKSLNNSSDDWLCSQKQRSFIERLMSENYLKIGQIDDLALRRFGRPIHQLNRSETSKIIDTLLDDYGSKKGGSKM
jgi:hypothetical protein